MNGYLFDTHIHTKESSRCGDVAAADVVARYKELGYDGIIITDHMHASNLRYKGETYEEKVNGFLEGYKAAKALEDDRFRVILGMELRFPENDNDYLVYGFDEEFVFNHNFLENFATLEDFVPFAKENGLVIYQAHPFRCGITVTDPELVDGVEVYNGHGGHDSRNDIAYHWATKFSLPMLSGSDYHYTSQMEPGGIYFEELPLNSYDVANLIKSQKYSLKTFTK